MTTNDITMYPLMLIRAAGLPLNWLDKLTAYEPAETEQHSDVAEIVSTAFDKALTALEPSSLRTGIYNARRDFFNKRKMPPPRLMRLLEKNLDIPVIAQLVESLEQWSGFINVEKQKIDLYNSAVQSNYRLLQQAAREETLLRALLFASHDLLDRLDSFVEKPVEDFNKKDRQTALSLLQYLTRAAAKTSPLSRFTTVGLARIGAETSFDQEYNPILKPHITPNVALLPALYEVLLREPAFYRALSVSLNPCIDPSLEPSAKISWLYFDGEQESFQQVDADPVTSFILKILLENGRAMSFIQLLSALENEVAASPEQLQSLVFELIDYGMLEWKLPEKGLSPGWCGELYNFLAFLSGQPPVVTEAAALLQWLRTAARTLTFQTIEEVRATQQATVALANDFFEKNGGTMPPVPPEQIFFEDVAETILLDLPEAAVNTIANDLTACWRQRDTHLSSPLRVSLFSFAEKKIPKGQIVDFQHFCKLYFEDQDRISETEGVPVALRKGRIGIEAQKIGALLQVFRDESGNYRAVVNGLFPGGGKLFARWLHLFPTETSDLLRNWFNAVGDEGLIPFPWQGWSNANFQPAISPVRLAVPDGRTNHLKGGRQIFLSNLAVKLDQYNLQLIDKETNEPVFLIDLGLEAPESRPPAMQILWHLGVPHVSLEAILPRRIWKEGGTHWRYAERVESGSLILARKSWQIDPIKYAEWLQEKSDAATFQRIRSEMAAMKIPRRFFARFNSEKPQYFDLDSPITIQLLTKMLRTGSSSLLLTEMLPLPEQCVVQNEPPRAAEFVLELTV